MTEQYFVYIVSSRSRVLYVGVTNDLHLRLAQHRARQIPGFTAKYHVNQLVFFESTPNISAAIAREKQIKGWLRRKKIALIEEMNPTWRDLSEDWP